MTFGTLVISLGVYANIQGILNPAIVEQAAQMSKAAKTEAYIAFTTIFYILPMAFSLIGFWLYDMSCKYVKIDKEYYKKKEWWML